MNTLEVRTSKLQLILAILLGLFFVPVGLLSLANGLSKGFAPLPLGLGFLMLVAYGAVIWLIRRGHANSVRYFTDQGLARNDGKTFAWADLNLVVNQIRITSVAHNNKALWRTEIQFKDGEAAWVIPSKVSNFAEVREFIRKLPCEHKEVRV
ncbi:MAG TPA: hypothetical protein VMS31_07160 [Pyrinomonadaceae bacterium]|nr:hypothetical protein [Pyrinomonadaceae bacterium]